MASYYGGSTLSAEQVAQVAYQAGFRGEALVQMVAIAKRESSYNSGAHRTDSSRGLLSGDRGLWQINASSWDNQLLAAGIIRQKSDLFDPVTNARAAFHVYQRQGLDAWAMGGNNSYRSGGDPFHRTNVEAARAAVNSATQKGILNSDWAQGGVAAPAAPATAGASGAPAGVPAGGGGTPAAQTTLPTDARLVSKRGALFALFNLGSGLWTHYRVGPGVNTGGLPIERIDDERRFQAKYGVSVDGGDAAELKNVRTTYGSYGKFWNSIVTQVIGEHNPAVNDPSVRRVLAEFAGRPDMSEAELQNKLKATPYWRSKTEGELAWNSLAPAEQQQRRMDAMSRMKQAWFQYTGEDIGLKDSRITQHREAVASGKMTFAAWTETFLKPRALQNKESPWSRQLRTEQEDQRQRGTDIENTVNRVRETLQRWGLRWSEVNLLNWGKAIVEKKRSDDDLLKIIQDQSKVLYPSKDPTIETQQWAAPYLEVYGRVMEEEGNLFTPEVGKALNRGTDVWDFEQGLKKSTKWLNTKNAREELFSIASEAGQRMGFV